MEYGLQLYSVWDHASKDMYATMKKVAEIGYKKVETAGLHGHSAKEVRAWADELGLEICSTHNGLGELADDFAGCVQTMKDLRCNEYIVAWADWSNAECLDKNIADLNKFQPMLAAEGINLSFHNHTGEFMSVDGRTPIEEMYNNTGINLEIDTFWAFAAGKNPIEVLEKYSDRVKMIHLKDGQKKLDENGNTFFAGRPLGTGDAPVAKVNEYAIAHNLTAIVESENQDPDGITEVTNCFKFLKSVE